MSVSIKTAREIELMRESCHLLEKVHDELAKAIRPGISTWEIDHLGEEMIRSFGCTPNFLHYNGYPASICVSVNDEVVHGIPSKKRILREGDIVSLDRIIKHPSFARCALICFSYFSISEKETFLEPKEIPLSAAAIFVPISGFSA